MVGLLVYAMLGLLADQLVRAIERPIAPKPGY